MHDMGGMHGFGPVIRDPSERALDEPPFHEPWEGRTFGLVVATSARTSGGLMRRPRFHQIAVESTMKLDDSVAMMGGT